MAFFTKDSTINANNEKKPKFVKSKKTWINDTKEDYHKQRLTQSTVAFWLSCAGAVLGFLVIISSLLANDNKWPGVIAGGVTEVVATLFYTLSNEANKKVSDFFDKLTLDSNTTQALQLIEKVEDLSVRDQLLTKTILHLIGLDEEKICKNTKEVCNKTE